MEQTKQIAKLLKGEYANISSRIKLTDNAIIKRIKEELTDYKISFSDIKVRCVNNDEMWIEIDEITYICNISSLSFNNGVLSYISIDEVRVLEK